MMCLNVCNTRMHPPLMLVFPRPPSVLDAVPPPEEEEIIPGQDNDVGDTHNPWAAVDHGLEDTSRFRVQVGNADEDLERDAMDAVDDMDFPSGPDDMVALDDVLQ